MLDHGLPQQGPSRELRAMQAVSKAGVRLHFVKAVVVLKPDGMATEDEIIAFARGRIAGFKCPKSIDFIAELPRNPSGKILKRELREPYWKGYERRVN